MKKCLILCIAFVVCWAKPDVSHITNNGYLPPEAPSSQHHVGVANASTASVQRARNNSPLFHPQIESIRPSIHVGSFSIRTIEPLEQPNVQERPSQYFRPSTQQAIFRPQIGQTSYMPSANYIHNNAPVQNQPNELLFKQMLNPPSAQHTQPYAHVPSTPTQHSFETSENPHQHYIQPQHSFAPKTAVPPQTFVEIYSSPNALHKERRTSDVQQAGFATFAAKQSYINQSVPPTPPAATQFPSVFTHQNIMPPHQTSQHEERRSQHQNVPSSTTAYPLEPQVSSPNRPSATPNYSTGQQSHISTTEELSQSFLPLPPALENLQQSNSHTFQQQMYSPTPFEKHNHSPSTTVGQQTINTDFDSARAYLPPTSLQMNGMQAIPQKQAYTTALDPQKASFQQQNFVHTRHAYLPPISSQTVLPMQQIYSSPQPTNVPQTFGPSSTEILPLPLQAPNTVQQFEIPLQTAQPRYTSTPKESQTSQVAMEIFAATATPIIEPKVQHFITSEATPATESDAIHPQQHYFPPMSTKQAFQNATGTYNIPSELNVENATPTPHSRTSDSSVDNEPQTRIYFYKVVTIEPDIVSRPSNQTSRSDSTLQPISNLGTDNDRIPPAPKLSSTAVNSFSYDPIIDPIEILKLIPPSWLEFDFKPQQPEETTKNAEIQSRNITNNHDISESRDFAQHILQNPIQKTELTENSYAGTEYASDGGYVYRRS